MGEWKRVKLGEVCTLVPGFAFKSGLFGEFPAKVIKITNIEDGISEEALSGVDVSGFAEGKLDKYLVTKGDYVVAMTGSIGKIGRVIEGKAYINQRVLTIRAMGLADKDFIYYLIRSKDFLNYMLTHVDSHSVQSNISAGTIGEYEFELPDLPTQRRVAAVLGALDDKIEVNRKICENLEAQAQALFKAWFVDFEPFGGKRPEGWKMGKLGDIVEFKNGFAFKSSEFKERARYKVMTIKAVQNGNLVTEGADCVDDIPAKMPSWCVLRDADILLSLTGNVARCCLVCEDDLLLNQRVAKLLPRMSEDVAFVYALFRSDETRKRLETIAKGTAQANLSPIESAGLLQLIPAEAERSRFANLCNPMIEAIVKTNRESRALAAMRDALLPKLMSGELAVEKVEVK